jgi:hypothetical protein
MRRGGVSARPQFFMAAQTRSADPFSAASGSPHDDEGGHAAAVVNLDLDQSSLGPTTAQDRTSARGMRAPSPTWRHGNNGVIGKEGRACQRPRSSFPLDGR